MTRSPRVARKRKKRMRSPKTGPPPTKKNRTATATLSPKRATQKPSRSSAIGNQRLTFQTVVTLRKRSQTQTKRCSKLSPKPKRLDSTWRKTATEEVVNAKRIQRVHRTRKRY